jgi:hypothetical protein
VNAAAPERAVRTPESVKEVAAEVVEKLPVRVSIADVSGTSIPLLSKIQTVIADVDAVVVYAKTADGKIRNARLLLQASDTLRRAFETALKLAEAMHEVDQVDRFHTIILEEIGELSPDTAEAILQRVGQISAEWGG